MKKILSFTFVFLLFFFIHASIAVSDYSRDSLHGCLLSTAEKFYECQVKCSTNTPGSQQCVDDCYIVRNSNEKDCYDKYS